MRRVYCVRTEEWQYLHSYLLVATLICSLWDIARICFGRALDYCLRVIIHFATFRMPCVFLAPWAFRGCHVFILELTKYLVSTNKSPRLPLTKSIATNYKSNQHSHSIAAVSVIEPKLFGGRNVPNILRRRTKAMARLEEPSSFQSRNISGRSGTQRDANPWAQNSAGE